MDGSKGGRRIACRRHLSRPPGAAFRSPQKPRALAATGRMAAELPPGGTVRHGRALAPRASRAGACRHAADGSQPGGQWGHTAARSAAAQLLRFRRRRAGAGAVDSGGHPHPGHVPAGSDPIERNQLSPLRPRRNAFEPVGAGVRGDQSAMGGPNRAERRIFGVQGARDRSAQRTPVRGLVGGLTCSRAGTDCSIATRRSSTSSIRCSISTPSGSK